MENAKLAPLPPLPTPCLPGAYHSFARRQRRHSPRGDDVSPQVNLILGFPGFPCDSNIAGTTAQNPRAGPHHARTYITYQSNSQFCFCVFRRFFLAMGCREETVAASGPL